MKYLLITFAGAALIYSCTPKVAEVAVTEVNSGEELVGLNDPQIAAGKHIWENDCTPCHYGGKVITNYTKDQWGGIMPKMIINAELDETGSTQIWAYVNWILENQ
ncbi:MAG: hypothetical protein P8H56_00475 [Crocinitomicaceae bacterium]|mgnify:FL=1|nr:hypothetical protein [Crocinitomicaceae bacterium]MDG1657033.1 hypothetical protein [Crocinitomicaceae bacterium]|tara:strand:+ start:332 stop:646 length:315 start_codon:yes stop_codon:yes gene_type:complete